MKTGASASTTRTDRNADPHHWLGSDTRPCPSSLWKRGFIGMSIGFVRLS